MLIHVRLGIPEHSTVDPWEIAKVFPYGRLVPIQTVTGGLEFPTGRIAEELGDIDDIGICVVACVTIGYDEAKNDDDDDDDDNDPSNNDGLVKLEGTHRTFNTKDGY